MKNFNPKIGSGTEDLDSLLDQIKDTQGISFFSSSENHSVEPNKILLQKERLQKRIKEHNKNNEYTDELF